MSGLSFGFCNEWIVSLLSVGEQIGPFLTAESAESAEQLKNLCDLCVLCGKTNTLEGDCQRMGNE